MDVIHQGSSACGTSPLSFSPHDPTDARSADGLLYCATVPVLANAYNWWKFVHVAGVFGFLLAHGASVSALFRLRKERDREKIRQLIQFSGSTIRLFYISLLVLMLGGVIAG